MVSFGQHHKLHPNNYITPFHKSNKQRVMRNLSVAFLYDLKVTDSIPRGLPSMVTDS